MKHLATSTGHSKCCRRMEDGSRLLGVYTAIDKIIEENCRDDPVKCCTELFRQWLSSDYGVDQKLGQH